MTPYRNRYNRKTVSVITPPAALAVSVADAKAYMLVAGAADDAIIERFIKVATDAAKRYLRRSIVPETLELQMDGFVRPDGDDAIAALGAGTHTASVSWLQGGTGDIDLPYPPVQSVVSVKVFTRANAEITADPAIYQLDQPGGRIYLNEGAVWPTDLRDRAAVQVRYIAGYSAIPEPIKQGILEHVNAMYECRSACEAPKISRAVMDGYRLADALGW